MLTTLSNWTSLYTDILHRLCKSFQDRPNLVILCVLSDFLPPTSKYFYTNIFVIFVTFRNSVCTVWHWQNFFPWISMDSLVICMGHAAWAPKGREDEVRRLEGPRPRSRAWRAPSCRIFHISALYSEVIYTIALVKNYCSRKADTRVVPSVSVARVQVSSDRYIQRCMH